MDLTQSARLEFWKEVVLHGHTVSSNDIGVKHNLSFGYNDRHGAQNYDWPMAEIEILNRTKAVARRVYIAEWAKKRGLRQADIARGLGVEPSLVSKWVKGTVTPEVKNLAALAEAFSLDDVSRLFRDPEDSDDWLDHVFSDKGKRAALKEAFEGRTEEEVERMLSTLKAAFPRYK